MPRINILFALLWLSACHAPAQTPIYSLKQGDPNGIGKWYMGREIAYVMGHQGIGWLERTEREEEENTTALLKNMALKLGETVADVGAGSGYHVVKMAPLVGPAGTVYAVDIQPEMIEFLQQRVQKAQLKQVKTVLNNDSSVQLPKAQVDKILLVDVYHEFAFPYEMAVSMLQALKPGGKLFLVEFRAEDRNVPIKTIHKMGVAQARKEFEAAGFVWVENISNLPWQHCMVFAKPG
jgi:protein-L-isoaspartate O-methyltransferase